MLSLGEHTTFSAPTDLIDSEGIILKLGFPFGEAGKPTGLTDEVWELSRRSRD